LQNDFAKNQKELALSQAKVGLFETEITELKKKNITLATDKLKLDSEVKDFKKKVNEEYSLKYDDNNFNMNGLKFKIKNSFPTHFILQTTVNLEDNDKIDITIKKRNIATKKFSEINKTIDKDDTALSITKNGLKLFKYMKKNDMLKQKDKWIFQIDFSFPSNEYYRIYRIQEKDDRIAFDTFMESLNENDDSFQENLKLLKNSKENLEKKKKELGKKNKEELEKINKELEEKKEKLEEKNKKELEKLEKKKEKLNAENTSLQSILELTATVEKCKRLEKKEHKELRELKDKSVKQIENRSAEEERKKKAEEDRKKKAEDARKKAEEKKKEKKKKFGLIDTSMFEPKGRSDDTTSRSKKISGLIDTSVFEPIGRSEGVIKVKLKKLI
jgi:hypothetical protein